MTTITVPEYITFNNWANDLNRSIPRLQIPTVLDEEQWQEWALSLIMVNNLTNIALPDKHSYPEKNDWKKWAYTFIQGIT